MKIPVKEPDKAFVSNQLWLPKEGNVLGGVRSGPIKRALEFTVGSRKNAKGEMEAYKVSMWDETKNHIICPREFLPPSEYPKYKFPFVDLRPQFGRAEFEDLVVPRNEEQVLAWQALATNDNGLLNLACGKGKTKLALKKIAQKGVPTLVVVPDGGMLEQWKQSILGSNRTPPGLNVNGEIGIVQGDTFDWKRPLTLALVTTLALKIRDGRIPEEFFRYFGLIIYDEVHQIGAPVFSQTAWPFYGDRIGLTATVTREDGLDPIYRYHIGEPFYSDLKQDLIPYVYFQRTPAVLPYDDAVRNGSINMSVLRCMLGVDASANSYRYWSIKEAKDQGRKILCLSHSKNQLRLFHAMFPDSGLIISETDRSERLDVLRNNQLTFAIAKLGTTGIDDDRLDKLFWLTPFKSINALQQSFGRIQRPLPGKPHPVVTIFEDSQVPTLKNMCTKVKSTLKEWQFPYAILNPSRFPRELPVDIRRIHDARLAELQPERIEAEE